MIEGYDRRNGKRGREEDHQGGGRGFEWSGEGGT